MATTGSSDPARTQQVAVELEAGEEFVTLRVAVLVAALLILVTGLLFYVLLQFWPVAPDEAVVTPTTTTGPTTTAAPATTVAPTQPSVVTVERTLPDPSVRLFGRTFTASRESRLLVIVVVAGAIGGMVHALRSLYWYAGNRRLVRSWLLMYSLLPVVGALLALIVYLLIRGGFVTGFGPTVEVSPYGSAAMAALVGLFSENASAKLRQVFSTLLTPAEQERIMPRRTCPTSRRSRRPAGRWAHA